MGKNDYIGIPQAIPTPPTPPPPTTTTRPKTRHDWYSCNLHLCMVFFSS